MFASLTDGALSRRAALLLVRLMGNPSDQDAADYRAIVTEGRRRGLPPGEVEPEWFVKTGLPKP